MKQAKLVLVNPPFAAAHYPSIQLGIVHAQASSREISTHTYYANLALFGRINSKLYNLLSDHRGFQVGDWLFSYAAFELDNDEEFLEKYEDQVSALCTEAEIEVEYLRELRHEIFPAFIDDCAAAVIDRGAEVVGFTSTFEQTVSGLAIARALKRKNNSIVTLFGGANFDDEMGRAHFRNHDFIDVVLNGDFEPAADSLFFHLGLTEQEAPLKPGIMSRLKKNVPVSELRSAIEDRIFSAPIPEYSDYFDMIHGDEIDVDQLNSKVIIPFESSRGCWWGEKNHCTFCGLNGGGMKFRQREASEVVEEMAVQNRRFGVSRFAAVDNIIGPKFMNDICDLSMEHELAFNIFYEVKANLKREQIKSFARAGIRSIQPGIESLSTDVLKLMKKGIRGIQNVNTLKWSYYYGVQCSWNLLYGFPGEKEEYYVEQLTNLKKIRHLPPPAGGGRIWLERFSPYYTGKAAGFSDFEYERSLDFVYPQSVEKAEISYFFSGKGSETISDSSYEATFKFLEEWNAAWDEDVPPYLYYMGLPGEIKIIDGRENINEPQIFRYKEPVGTILRHIGERPESLGNIADHLHNVNGKNYNLDSLEKILELLSDRGILMSEGGLYLSLAVPMSNHKKM